MQSESSILQKASEDIKKLVENNGTSKNLKEKNLIEEPKQVSDSSILKARLQDQVRTGEMTPFQAAKKEKDTKNILG